MKEISTNPTIRRNQFHKAARDVLERAKSPWAPTDRVGQFAKLMENAYQSGRQNVGRAEEPLVDGGHVRWDAIPKRSQDVLELIQIHTARRIREIADGTLIVVLNGALPTGRKGERALLQFWDANADGKTMSVQNEGRPKNEWAATSVSALVRLGIFEMLPTAGTADRLATLTTLGLATILTAVRDGHIYTYPDHSQGAGQTT